MGSLVVALVLFQVTRFKIGEKDSDQFSPVGTDSWGLSISEPPSGYWKMVWRVWRKKISLAILLIPFLTFGACRLKEPTRRKRHSDTKRLATEKFGAKIEKRLRKKNNKIWRGTG